MHTGVIWPRGVNTGQLTEAEMKGCQVGYWTVGEKDMKMSCIVIFFLILHV